MAIKKNRFEAGNESAWKELREKLIAEGRLGGSMVGVAAGVSGYKSATRLWAELKGLLPVEDISGREGVRNGKDLEGYVAERFAELSGKEVHRENCIFTNDDYPHLFASIDRKIDNEESGLECKTANALMAQRFTDDAFPQTYYAQVCSYLAVTGLKRWYLCVWVMGLFVKTYLLTTVKDEVANPPEWCACAVYVSPDELMSCETVAAQFVESLKLDSCPYIDGSDDATDALKELYPHSNGQTQHLGLDIDLMLQERSFLKAEIDERECRISEIENIVREALGEDEVGVSDHFKVTYKTSASKRLNNDAIKAAHGGTIPEEYYKLSEGRTLRITAAKAKKA